MEKLYSCSGSVAQGATVFSDGASVASYEADGWLPVGSVLECSRQGTEWACRVLLYEDERGRPWNPAPLHGRLLLSGEGPAPGSGDVPYVSARRDGEGDLASGATVPDGAHQEGPFAGPGEGAEPGGVADRASPPGRDARIEAMRARLSGLWGPDGLPAELEDEEEPTRWEMMAGPEATGE